MWISCSPWEDVTGRVFHLCGFLSRNPKPWSNHEENIRQTQIAGHLTKHLSSTPQNGQDHRKRGTMEKLSQTRRLRKHEC